MSEAKDCLHAAKGCLHAAKGCLHAAVIRLRNGKRRLGEAVKSHLREGEAVKSHLRASKNASARGLGELRLCAAESRLRAAK